MIDGRDMTIEAHRAIKSFGRLINHSAKHPNVEPRLRRIKLNDGYVRDMVLFYTTRVIRENEELFFDYGKEYKDSEEWYEKCWCVECYIYSLTSELLHQKTVTHKKKQLLKKTKPLFLTIPNTSIVYSTHAGKYCNKCIYNIPACVHVCILYATHHTLCPPTTRALVVNLKWSIFIHASHLHTRLYPVQG
jgi:hypothetical protein